MPIDAHNMLDPLTPLPYLELAADTLPPTSLADPHVYRVAPDDRSREVEEQWQFQGIYTNPPNGNPVLDVVIWCYNPKAGLFFPLAAMEIAKTVTTLVGNVMDLPGVLGTTHVGVQMTGLTPAVGRALQLVHNHR